jgi:hypothetical protein
LDGVTDTNTPAIRFDSGERAESLTKDATWRVLAPILVISGEDGVGREYLYAVVLVRKYVAAALIPFSTGLMITIIAISLSSVKTVFDMEVGSTIVAVIPDLPIVATCEKAR